MKARSIFFVMVMVFMTQANAFCKTSFPGSLSFSFEDSIKIQANYNTEIDQNRLMLLDATLELNNALLDGVKASLDTFNLPETNPKGNDTLARLRKMKREREQKEMKSYLEYMKDSLTGDCQKILREKEIILSRLNPNLRPTKAQEDSLLNLKQKTPPVVQTSIDLALKKKNPSPDTVIAYKPAKPLEIIYPEKGIPIPTVEELHPPITKAIPVVTNQPPTDTGAIPKNPGKEILESKQLTGKNESSDTIARIKSNFFLTSAQKARVEHNFKQAEEYLNFSTGLWRGNYEAWFALAELSAEMGSVKKALESYEECIRIDPYKSKAFYSMGCLYLEVYDTAQAIKNLNKAIQLDKGYIAAFMKRASLFTGLGQYSAAIGDYDYVLSFNKNYYKAYKGRGISKLLNKDFKQAIDDFTRYMIFDQSDAEIYYYRGLAKIGNNEWLDGCLELSISSNMGNTQAAKAMKKNCE